MEYYYLVVYAFENGYGTAQIIRNKEITSFEDIKEIEEQLNKQENFKTYIMNYTLVGSKQVNKSKIETMSEEDKEKNKKSY